MLRDMPHYSHTHKMFSSVRNSLKNGKNEEEKAFNRYVRQLVDQYLDKEVVISKQPEDKVELIVQSCREKFPEFAHWTTTRIRIYIESCRRLKKIKNSPLLLAKRKAAGRRFREGQKLKKIISSQYSIHAAEANRQLAEYIMRANGNLAPTDRLPHHCLDSSPSLDEEQIQGPLSFVKAEPEIDVSSAFKSVSRTTFDPVLEGTPLQFGGLERPIKPDTPVMSPVLHNIMQLTPQLLKLQHTQQMPTMTTPSSPLTPSSQIMTSQSSPLTSSYPLIVSPRTPIITSHSTLTSQTSMLRQTSPVSMIRQTSPVSMIRQPSPVSMIRQTSPVSMISQTSPVSMIRQTSPVSMIRQTSPGTKVSMIRQNLSPSVGSPTRQTSSSPFTPSPSSISPNITPIIDILRCPVSVQKEVPDVDVDEEPTKMEIEELARTTQPNTPVILTIDPTPTLKNPFIYNNSSPKSFKIENLISQSPAPLSKIESLIRQTAPNSMSKIENVIQFSTQHLNTPPQNPPSYHNNQLQHHINSRASILGRSNILDKPLYPTGGMTFSEIINAKTLVTSYREAANFLYRAATELEQLLPNDHKVF